MKKQKKNIKITKRKLYFSKLILNYKSNICNRNRKAIGKEKYKQQNLLKKILVDKKSITETESIAESLNKYFTQIGPTLAKDIGTSTKSFNDTLRNMTLPSQKKQYL